ncbi:MAG TPA: tRNA uridine-5-carboxymethylaminomethyl(34) synthesis enzyme MnmG [Planctomycetota bacterium]|nr:tRNA uridine-5-carboxymethylaminomethyl(34) synthesis enzyme MnmG [Planctomycetota bacterium]
MNESVRASAPRVAVIGGGHAGVEAACVAARMGARVELVTLSAGALGRMSCNPSIGGIAKGQIVREVDALGGVMGKLADRSAIHHRLLNRSKGPAVQSPRCQNDRALYAREAAAEAARAGVTVREGEVVDLVVEGGRVRGVELADGARLAADAVVLTTGTFLGAVMHVGLETTEGGRVGERAAVPLAARLRGLGFRTGRLKTGTPPRLRASSIDWDRTEPQPSDDDPVRFSFEPQPAPARGVACAITRTTAATHAIIREGLDRSPLFTGKIRGTGPRYCPSVEDKIFRFGDKESHQVFLEPEGLDSDLVYPNGVSTSLPRDVQERLVRSVPGLERAEIVQYGYAVEYDYVDPTECDATLETRRLPGLFLAGQINGTTGYEEAAGQGLVAGANAALKTAGAGPFVLSRAEAYLGVLVDDLVTRGVDEPYRMFTSLAEHRLLLRHHNADLRLLEHAERLGAASAERLAATRARAARTREAREALESARHEGRSWWERLRRPDGDVDAALRAAGRAELAAALTREDREDLEIEARYAGYLDREREAAERLKASDARLLPPDLDYAAVPHLRAEARQKFERVRPRTAGQALRLPGISPADLNLLLVHVARLEQAGRGRGPASGAATPCPA